VAFAAQRPCEAREDFEVQMVKNRHCQLKKWLKMLKNGHFHGQNGANWSKIGSFKEEMTIFSRSLTILAV